MRRQHQEQGQRSMHTRLSRAEVPVESTWNLDDLFADDTAWERECEAVDDALRQVIDDMFIQPGYRLGNASEKDRPGNK